MSGQLTRTLGRRCKRCSLIMSNAGRIEHHLLGPWRGESCWQWAPSQRPAVLRCRVVAQQQGQRQAGRRQA